MTSIFKNMRENINRSFEVVLRENVSAQNFFEFHVFVSLYKVVLANHYQGFGARKAKQEPVKNPYTLSDKISADKTAENPTCCRKFCPIRYLLNPG